MNMVVTFIFLTILVVALLLLYKFRGNVRNIFSSHSRIFLNICWYLFIIVFIGQLGPLIGYASAFWNGKDVLVTIQESAGKAELLTCATAILAGGTFFLVREYNSPQQINNRGMKSFLILLSALLGLLCIGLTAQLLTKNGFENNKQKIVHWILYFFALLMAFLLWIFEELQGTADQEMKKISQDVSDLTEKSRDNEKINGVKV